MPEEIIQIEDEYYILATSSRTEDRPRVVKDDDSFGVFDHAGAIRHVALGEQGLYHDGTRYLSRFELLVQGRRLQPLRSTVRRDHVLVVDLANPDLVELAEPLRRESIHVVLTSFLYRQAWYARIHIHNYALRPVELEASVRLAADYSDIFEIRGTKRAHRGTLLAPTVDGAQLLLGYDGLDGVRRSTRVVFSPSPRTLDSSSATFDLSLQPRGEQSVEITALFVGHDRNVAAPSRPEILGFEEALARRSNIVVTGATMKTSHPRVQTWLERSESDIQLMTTAMATGPYPYAGVPWFSTVFGRDGIITAFERLWLDPDLARGVLVHLAATQATALDPERDAEPGKIVHETRRGEMAALGEIPFGCYYGSVDATPLFVALAAAYWRRTADRELIESIWPNVQRALDWINNYGDLDGDGFVEYARRTPKGLLSQGWKDSHDSISHRDGTIADGPIALCEVQAYVYAARRGGALLARVLGREEYARTLDGQADELRTRFDETFWSEELGTYYLALDGAKRPCAVRASNAGHALFSGIALPARASRVADALMSEHSFSGWGIRTLDDRETRYNPMSYHNGSVWPHDNAMAALGMVRYGQSKYALHVLRAHYQASVHFDLQRMPELFCGFPRHASAGPIPYPVACAPQAWAAGAVFMLIQACLGLDIDATRREVRLTRPGLPENVDSLSIQNLRVLDATADVTVQRQGPHVAVHVDRCHGELEIVAVKGGR